MEGDCVRAATSFAHDLVFTEYVVPTEADRLLDRGASCPD